MVPLDANTLQFGGSSDSIYQTALQIIPNIKATDLRVRSFEKAIAVARGKLYPTLSFYGSINSNYTSIATTGIPGTDFKTSTGQFVKSAPQAMMCRLIPYNSKKSVLATSSKTTGYEYRLTAEYSDIKLFIDTKQCQTGKDQSAKCKSGCQCIPESVAAAG